MYKLYILTSESGTELECDSLEDGIDGVNEYINDLVKSGEYENDFAELNQHELEDFTVEKGTPVYGKHSTEYYMAIIVSKI